MAIYITIISEVVGKVIDANNIEVWKNSELANLNNEKEIQLRCDSSR